MGLTASVRDAAGNAGVRNGLTEAKKSRLFCSGHLQNDIPEALWS